MEDDWGLETDAAEIDSWQDGGVAPRFSGGEKFHLSLFLHALAGAAVGALIGKLIYQVMYRPSENNILMVGLVLGVIAACILMACALCELRKPRITMNRELNWQRLLLGLLGAVAVFGLGCLCEFLYELNGVLIPVTFDDYVFAIDDSGSMSSTDPQDLRYDAMRELLVSLGEKKRAGLVRFTDSVYTAPVDMAYLDETHMETLNDAIAQHRSDGGTDIYTALMTALDLYERGGESGRAAVVVLLSDGGSSVPIDDVSERFVDAGIVINTVSLGNGANESLLQNLAQATGGQYFRVEQAGELVEAFQHVSSAVSYRCLFTPRPGPQRGSPLLMLLRILFLMLPGEAIALFLLLLLQDSRGGRQLLVSAVTGLLAGIVMEVGTFFFLPLVLTQLVSWVLYGIVLLHYIDNFTGRRQGKLDQPFIDDALPDAYEQAVSGEPGVLTRKKGKQSAGKVERTH